MQWPAGAPVYAAQAIADVIAAAPSSHLALPPGLTWTSSPFAGPIGGQATIVFQPPAGDAFDCTSPPPTATASGNFAGASVQSCTSGAITIQVRFGNATSPTAGTITLGVFSIAGSSAGLAQLAPVNPPPAALNCAYTVAPACLISADATASSNQALINTAQTLTAVMAESGDAFAAAALALPQDGAANSVCIDVFSYHSNGEAFQQPCTPGTPGGSGPLSDKGSVTITETYYLGADGVHAFVFEDAGGTVTLKGTCGGTVGGTASGTPGSCGVLPLTGEAVYLVPEPQPPDIACPATAAAAASVPGSVAADISPPAGSFGNVAFPNATATSTIGATGTAIYEVCGYALGNQIVGDVAAWSASASIDQGLPDATTVAATGAGLLTYSYNGAIDWFNFTNGGYGDIAFLRLVNRNPWEPLTLGVNGEEVVCLVQADDGTSGYASLYTNAGQTTSNDNNAPGNPAIIAGQNAFYAVPTLFANAGIVPTAANPFDLGALTCFHDYQLHLVQVWMEPSGTIVNIE